MNPTRTALLFSTLLLTATLPAAPPAAPDIQPTPDKALAAKLELPLKELTADSQSLEKIINFLRDTMNINVVVNWKALEGSGVARDSSVTVSLKNVPFRKALATVLDAASPNHTLSFTVDEGVLVISTREDLQSPKYQKVEFFDIPDFIAAEPAPPTFLPPLFGAPTHVRDEWSPENPLSSVKSAITDNIDPITWRDNGGSVGTIREANGKLIVNQTQENLDRIRAFLPRFASSTFIKTNLETHAFLIDDAALAALPKSPDGQNIELDPKQTDDLLRVIAADKGVTRLARAHFTLLNARHSYVTNTELSSYITSSISNPDAQGKQHPQIETTPFSTGFILDFAAAAPFDHPVNLQLKASYRQLLRLESYQPLVGEAPIQRPVFAEAEISTSLHITNDHAILLTGPKVPPTPDAPKDAESRTLLLLVKASAAAPPAPTAPPK